MGYGGVRDAEGAPEGRSRRRRDGAPRTPEQPDPSAARGTPQKLSYNKAQIGIILGA